MLKEQGLGKINNRVKILKWILGMEKYPSVSTEIIGNLINHLH